MLLFKGCTGKRSRLCLRFNFNLQWGIRYLIWSAPPYSAFRDIRMRGGAFVMWCKGPRTLYSGSLHYACFQSPSSPELYTARNARA